MRNPAKYYACEVNLDSSRFQQWRPRLGLGDAGRQLENPKQLEGDDCDSAWSGLWEALAFV